MSRPLKRARTSGVRVQRPIDKELKVVNLTATTTVASTTLKTTTFPGTVVGLRWSMGTSALTAGDALLQWAVVVVPDGEAVNTPSTTGGADFYTPEQNVLAFGVARIMNNAETGGNMNYNWEGTTKTMRKLKQGDVLAFLVFSDVANSQTVDGIVQFFFKT